MKVRFRQTGGFGGLVLGCDLNTADLSSPDREALFKLVKQAKLASVKAKKNEQGRDLTNYEIAIQSRGRTTTASFDDMSTPSQVEPLLEFLRDRMRAVPLE